jgi:hypothetical protein
VKPKLDAVIAIIDGILAQDKGRPKKQQHTAKRIFERLRENARRSRIQRVYGSADRSPENHTGPWL